MKTFLHSVALVSALAAVSSIQVHANAARPNILLIMCDDLGYSDVGFTGSPDIRTPAMDALARAGTICSSGYVTHPFCGPSRMGMMAGRYAHTFGGQYNLPPTQLGIEEYNKLGIPVSEILFSTVLQQAGYITGLVGKWHLGEEPEYHPNNRGFDDFYGFLPGGHNYFPEQYERAYEAQKKSGRLINDYLRPLEHNGKETKEDEYLTDALSDHAVGFIKDAAKTNKPFFLFVSYNAPHTPMEAKEEDMEPYAHIANKKRRIVAGMMAAVDRGVGELTDALKSTGQFDNTLIVFLSDNGGKPSMGSSNAPFRGTKGDTWEGGFRVPMFWHWPKQIPVQTFDHPVSSLDFYPTFANLAGAVIPESKMLDGNDIFADLVEGKNPRKGEMIYSMRHRNSYNDVSARRDDWKITRYRNQPWRLFNITEDPGENNDLASQYPERVEQMVRTTESWSRGHIEPLWFHARQARDQWAANDMPRFDRTFEPSIGAPAEPPAVHLTDIQPELPPVQRSDTSGIPAPPAGYVMKNGDSTFEQFAAREKKKWDSKGWTWDQSKVEANFRKIDTDNNGILSGAEKKAFWSGGATPPPSSNPPARTAQRPLKNGESTLESFSAREKTKWEQKGWPWDAAKVEATFRSMDTDGDGILTVPEKKAFWNK